MYISFTHINQSSKRQPSWNTNVIPSAALLDRCDFEKINVGNV